MLMVGHTHEDIDQAFRIIAEELKRRRVIKTIPDYLDADDDGDGFSENEGDCEERVLRGGSWDFLPGYSRSMARIMFSASFRSNSYGFRVAKTLSQ